MRLYPLATALLASPPGTLIEAAAYYAFSSVFFCTDRKALLLNGGNNNLEYGSYAPNAPQVFIGDAEFVSKWYSAERYYLLAHNGDLPHLRELVGEARLQRREAEQRQIAAEQPLSRTATRIAEVAGGSGCVQRESGAGAAPRIVPTTVRFE